MDGRLQVLCHGSRLNEVLREIGRVAAISVSGSAGDERVFGTYGPGTPGEVIAALLDGTATNMLLREGTAARPGELILSRRTGGVSPPRASASFNNAAPSPQPPLPYQPPAPYQAAPALPQPAAAAPQMQNSPPASSAGPGGPSTPEQIYQQLQRLQQNKQPQ